MRARARSRIAKEFIVPREAADELARDTFLADGRDVRRGGVD